MALANYDDVHDASSTVVKTSLRWYIIRRKGMTQSILPNLYTLFPSIL